MELLQFIYTGYDFGGIELGILGLLCTGVVHIQVLVHRWRVVSVRASLDITQFLPIKLLQ